MAKTFSVRLSLEVQNVFKANKIGDTTTKLPQLILIEAARLIEAGKDPLAILKADKEQPAEKQSGKIEPRQSEDTELILHHIDQAFARAVGKFKIPPAINYESEKFLRETVEHLDEKFAQFYAVATVLIRHVTNTSENDVEEWLKTIFPTHQLEKFNPELRRRIRLQEQKQKDSEE